MARLPGHAPAVLALLLGGGCQAIVDSSDFTGGGDAERCTNSCGGGLYCESTGCDVEGRCLPTPDECPLGGSPVCGCDGTTYVNECELQRSGGALDHRGRCDDDTCVDSCSDGFFCDSAGCGSEGTCVPAPADCPDDYNPVCGCDGSTYGNLCQMRQAGVTRFHMGSCEGVGDCYDDGGCAGNEFCEFPDYSCSGPGVCKEVPVRCDAPPGGGPRCGCDGVTYYDDCSRQQNHQSVQFDGPCDGPPAGCNPDVSTCNECYADGDCFDGEFCDRPPGNCWTSNRGVCVQPYDCESSTPTATVCGCDNVTYYDLCSRRNNYAGIAFDGECETVEGCYHSDECRADQYCQPNSWGACGSEGTCQLRPRQCPPDFQPVCGCNDETFENECVANQFGEAYWFEGPCMTASYCFPGDPDACPDAAVQYCAADSFGSSGALCMDGICVRRPEGYECDRTADRLCGCDGNWHTGNCNRRLNGAGFAGDDSYCGTTP